LFSAKTAKFAVWRIETRQIEQLVSQNNDHTECSTWQLPEFGDKSRDMVSSTDHSRGALLSRLQLVLLLIFAGCLRFYHLGKESLWFDEAISFRRSGYAFSELIADSIHAFHNPSYFILLRAFRVVGDSEFALRLPSAIFGVGKVWLTYVVARRILGHKGGLVAAAFIALCRYQIHYDQEARMYAPLLFFTTLALSGLVYVVARRDSDAQLNRLNDSRGSWPSKGEREQPKSLRFAWGSFVVGTTGALYLHNTAVLFVAATWCAVGAVVLFTPKGTLSLMKGWVGVNGIILVLFAPWIRTLFEQSESMTERVRSKAFPSLSHVFDTIHEVYLGGLNSPLVTFSILALSLLGVWHLGKDKRVFVFLLTLTLSTPILFLLVSLKQPMYLTRLLLWSAVPFSIFVAAGLTSIPGRFGPAVFGFCLLVLLLFRLHADYYTTLQKPDWRKAITELSKAVSEDSVVLAVGDREWRLFYYYFNRKDRPYSEFLVHYDVPKMAGALPDLIKDKKTVWTVRTRDYREGRMVRERLATLGKRMWSRKYGPRLVLEKYDLSRAVGLSEKGTTDEPSLEEIDK
jgi:4-amino-4-deoxy-L-arabinose transferase-like glycosyltransferase